MVFEIDALCVYGRPYKDCFLGRKSRMLYVYTGYVYLAPFLVNQFRLFLSDNNVVCAFYTTDTCIPCPSSGKRLGFPQIFANVKILTQNMKYVIYQSNSNFPQSVSPKTE